MMGAYSNHRIFLDDFGTKELSEVKMFRLKMTLLSAPKTDGP